tara:strand:- start:143714 stop:144148 length:435 start_codon:yes stop_codon:yes gene_type:complete
MRIAESPYNDKYEKKVTTSSGDFYFFNKFIVSEISTGVHFNWEIGKEIIDLAYKHYGENIRVAYISNRVNDYSVNAQDWLKFFNERHHLEAFAIVAYSKIGLMNVILEKIFVQTKIRKFDSLEAAITWVLRLDQLKKIEPEQNQ